MSTTKTFQSEIDLIRREIKNIRQELLKQKSNLKYETERVESLLQVQVTSEVENHCSKNEGDRESDKHYLMKPIGFISSCFKHKNGIPRQPLLTPSSKAILEIDKTHFTNPEHSLIGLEKFSHIWLIFVFHKNGPEISVKAKVHPPRLNGASTGVFSSRSPHRPCPIGLSLTKLEKIDGSVLFLSGIDVLDGTPVLDVKPYIPHYDVPIPLQDVDCSSEIPAQEIVNSQKKQEGETSASDENSAMISLLNQPPDHLQVVFTGRATSDLNSFHGASLHLRRCPFCFQFLGSREEAKQAIVEVLRNDPRSVYRRNKCSDKLYYFEVDVMHVTSWFDEDTAEVLKIKPVEVTSAET